MNKNIRAKLMHRAQQLGLVGVAAIAFVENAMAAMDLTPITSAVDVGTISVAIIALSAIKMGPGVAKWAGNKLSSFFG